MFSVKLIMFVLYTVISSVKKRLFENVPVVSMRILLEFIKVF
jgi:hypothetical protein